jgi:hypothetical protein
LECTVRSVSGGRLVVDGKTPSAAKTLSLFFPAIYAVRAEFVEVQDLTINGGGGGWGGFCAAALTFGQVSGARLRRVHVAHWSGDGLSLQTCGDAILADNTVTRCYNGYHPGGNTRRFLALRNVGLGNANAGLYFCWHNRNGIYLQNTLDRFDGFGWPFDIFNVLCANRCARQAGWAIEQSEGGGDLLFGNESPSLRFAPGKTGNTLDCLVAGNRFDAISVIPADGPSGGLRGNMVVGNRAADGGPVHCAIGEFSGNCFMPAEMPGLPENLPAPVTRSDPLPSVHRPPVLDGGPDYRPDQPDAGFQAALDRLQAGGGTLLLPAGRYSLARPLRVPAGVTLAGRGVATILQPAETGRSSSLIRVEKGDNAGICELTILGDYRRGAATPPAIEWRGGSGTIQSVDVRGWPGDGISVSDALVTVELCRALDCAGFGFRLASCRIGAVANIARGCAGGFRLESVRAGSRLTGNIAGENRGPGLSAGGGDGLEIIAGNFGFNDGEGVVLRDIQRADLLACMFSGNGQDPGAGGCAVRLSETASGCRVFYNNFQDTQRVPCQTMAVCEEATAAMNKVRFNLYRNAALSCSGAGTTVGDNFCGK